MRIIARLNVGGPAKHVVWLNSRLGDEFDSMLVTGSVPPGEADMSDFAQQHAVSVITIPEMSREIGPRDAVVLWKLFRLMRRHSPSIVHTHTAKAGAVGRAAATLYNWTRFFGRRRERCVIVHTYHGHVFHSYYGKLLTSVFLAIERTLARVTDHLVVISQQQYREISETFRIGRPAQFRVVPLGLDLESVVGDRSARESFRSRYGLRSDEFVVGIVGRLAEIKNHEMFLAAARDVEKTDRNVRFVVIGDGHLRAQIETRARELGCERVLFAGVHHDPRSFYPALDLIALTSLNEGTPLAVIEGMANGIPSVATEVGGVVDLGGAVETRELGDRIAIRERMITVPSRDHEAFASAVRKLVHDPELRSRLGLRGREFVETSYSLRRLVSDVRTMYRDLAAKNATQRSAQHATEVTTK